MTRKYFGNGRRTPDGVRASLRAAYVTDRRHDDHPQLWLSRPSGGGNVISRGYFQRGRKAHVGDHRDTQHLHPRVDGNHDLGHPLNLMDRVGAGCISRILSGSGGILEDKT